MHRIYLEPPLVRGQVATFRWRVEPATELYRETQFTLLFPPAVDLSAVPERLWWDVFLFCLHSHWLLLRPCEIHLPLRLGPGERQFWLQHLRNGAETLDAYGGKSWENDLRITIRDGDLEVLRRPVAGNGYATSFSSGKDSLLQAALLAELTERPLLVATTSPMPSFHDHKTERRRQVFAAIQTRRPVRFVEAESNFRGSWDNSFPFRLGYELSVNELTDTHLYTSTLAISGASLGATRLFVASETEMQESTVIGGRIVQHLHFMYTAATQRTLARLLYLYGIRYGSLTWPLYGIQVQRLLWARYPDLSDLQYTCWRVGPHDATCSQCNQCLRIAAVALADGHDPQRMGIDLDRLLAFAPTWPPLQGIGATPPSEPILPRHAFRRRLEACTIDAIRRISLPHLAGLLSGHSLRRLFSRPVRRSLGDFRQLRRRARQAPRPAPMRIREAFCDWLDPELRDRLVAIYRHHFEVEPRRDHLALVERSRMLTERAASCLDGEAPALAHLLSLFHPDHRRYAREAARISGSDKRT